MPNDETFREKSIELREKIRLMPKGEAKEVYKRLHRTVSHLNYGMNEHKKRVKEFEENQVE